MLATVTSASGFSTTSASSGGTPSRSICDRRTSTCARRRLLSSSSAASRARRSARSARMSSAVGSSERIAPTSCSEKPSSLSAMMRLRRGSCSSVYER